MALFSAKRVPGGRGSPAFTATERRWMWVTELPFLVCAVAIAVWVEPQRPSDPLLCVVLVVAYAWASRVQIALPDGGHASSSQLVLVPMLLLLPLNLVPLLVLAGNLIEVVAFNVQERRPQARSVIALSNSVYVLAPVAVLVVAGYDTFAWSDWPVYVAALVAQIVFDVLFSTLRVRLYTGVWLIAEAMRAPVLIDVVLSLPALGIVAIAEDAPLAAVLIEAALLAIASGFTTERSHRLAEGKRAAEDARRALLAERVRIARELHDVVAHHVSLIGVQAGAARLVMGRDPDKAKETLSQIESSSRQAVHELHQLLGFLRQDGDADDIGPQPGLGQLTQLTAAMRDSPIAVKVHVEGDPRPLAPTVDASAYRIVQEALTNTLKHARATRADVRLRYLPGELEIEVVDDGRGDGQASTTGGLGLIGMRERAVLHGGDLTAGAQPGGGFLVRARLPAKTLEP